jgi:hypothetical protein
LTFSKRESQKGKLTTVYLIFTIIAVRLSVTSLDYVNTRAFVTLKFVWQATYNMWVENNTLKLINNLRIKQMRYPKIVMTQDLE